MKILSVDFDYIMHPCIKLYNQYVSEDENTTVLWERLEQMMEIDKYLTYDTEALCAITNLLVGNVLNKAKFIPIVNHEEIVDYLKQLPNYETSVYDILNIDYHHDLAYNEDTIAEIQDFDKYTCANWLGYLYLTDRTKRVRWLKAPNSEMCELPEFQNVEILQKRHLKEIENDFDLVFLCLSPQWIPYKYTHLYDLLVASLQQIESYVNSAKGGGDSA